jgi:hypothetical protein
MTKLGLFVACTSLLALDGCASMRPFTKSGRADDEQASKLQWRNDSVERAQQNTKDGMPSELEKLEDAYDAWANARRELLEFANETSFANQELGNCFTGKRKNNEYCKKAKQTIAEAETSMAEILEAAQTAAASATSAFPAKQLVIATADPVLSKALHADDAFQSLADRQAKQFAKRLKKTSAKTLVRKADEGMCFFSTEPHGNEVQPAFLFDTSVDELYVRCIAPDPLRSYERTQNDSIVVELLGSESFELVKEFSISDMSADETSEIAIPVSAIARFAGREHKNWSHVPLQVRYVVNKKDGVSEVTSGSKHVRFEDHIDHRTVAKGVVVVQVKGEHASNDEADDDADADADEDDDVRRETRKTRPTVSNRPERNKPKKRRAR